MKCDAVLFDLDGTLLNTLDDLADSVNEMLEIGGYPKRSIDEVRKFLGNGMKKLVERSLPHKVDDEEFQKCYNIFRERYKLNMKNKTAPYDGIVPLLIELHKKGIKIAVVSNKNNEAVVPLCDEIFGELTDFKIGVSSKVLPKPDTSMIDECVSNLNVRKDRCIMVGDGETDVRTAKNSGVKSVAVLWGFRDLDELEVEKPDFIVKYPADLLKIL